MAKAYVVVGKGETEIQVLRTAATSEKDWETFAELDPDRAHEAANIRGEGGAWCVSVMAVDVTEAELDADDAVRMYVEQDIDSSPMVLEVAKVCADEHLVQGWQGNGDRYDLGVYFGDAEVLRQKLGFQPGRVERIDFECAIRDRLTAAHKGAVSGVAEVETVLQEQGRAIVIATLAPGHLDWDEDAINARCHAIEGVNDEHQDVYYRAYAVAARKRAEELRDEVKRGEEISSPYIQEWAGTDGAVIEWSNGQAGDMRVRGWRRLEDNARAIETNGNPLFEDDDDFENYWQARDIALEAA